MLGAATLLSLQSAAYASPATLDPLVSLSALGSAQSRAAVCAGSTAAVAAAGAAATAAQGAPGCVLPVNSPTPPVVSQAVPPAVAIAPAPAFGIGTLPLLLGLAAIIGAVALVLMSNDNNEGDVTPVSPA